MKLKYFALIFLIVIVSTFIYNGIPNAPLPSGSVIDSIAVHKSRRILEVFSKRNLLKTYKMSLGLSPEGDKIFEGDKKTPEGKYSINAKNPNSSFCRNLGISYPNEQDIAEATAVGKLPGGDIKIHGLGFRGFLGKTHLWIDWTAGCIAVTNDEIKELYGAVPLGTPVLILK